MLSKIRYRWKGFTRQERIVLPIFYFFMFILAVWALFPIFFALLNSLKTALDYNDSAIGLPKVWNFANYAQAIKITYRNTTVLGMFLNSIIYSVTFSFANIFSSCMSAYVMSKYKFKLRNFLYALAIFIQIIPIFGTTSAGYLLVNRLGLHDNLFLLWITACGGFDYTFLIVYSYFENVSWDYAEAAYIDGAGNWYVFLKIMIPMVLPAILMMWLSAITSLWNDYMGPYIYLPSYPTLSTGIFNLKNLASYLSGGVTVYFAAIIISMLPILILFFFLQKRILNLSLDGGLKG